LTWRHDPRLG